MSGVLTEPVLALRNEFGYPEAVIRAVADTVNALMKLEPRSVVLMGSAARGELSWRETARGLELLSDLELACFVDRRDSRSEAEARARIRKIAAATALDNGLFHIDVLVAKRFPSGRNSRGLLWYEAGRFHRVLHGRLRSSDFGDVDPARVSLGLINELVIVRLWWMLVHFPVRVLDHPSIPLPEPDRERMVYIQVRNILDVASIWLPNTGAFEVGYRARARGVRNEWASLDGARFLPADFPAWLEEATRKKLECDLTGDPVEWYHRAVLSYRGLVGYLLDTDAVSENPLADGARDRWTRLHPAPRSWRFRAYRAWATLRRAARPGGARWLKRRDDPAAAALEFLLWMHAAALHRLESRGEEAEDAVRGAREALAALAVEVPDVDRASGSFPQRWHALRAGLVDPFMEHYRKVRGQRRAVDERLRSEEKGISG